VFARAGKTDPPSLLILSQTSAGKGISGPFEQLSRLVEMAYDGVERRPAMIRLYFGFALMVLLSPAATANDTSIVGSWKFQSFFREVIGTGERQIEFGEKPSGYISYQPDGRMFAMLVGDNRIKPSGAVPTDGEKIKLFGTLIAYSGTYVVDGDKITHKIDVSWNQKWTGTDEVRFYKIEGRTLTITTAINKNPRDGREGRSVAVFTKAQ
jgi:Lipocalin-like domain